MGNSIYYVPERKENVGFAQLINLHNLRAVREEDDKYSKLIWMSYIESSLEALGGSALPSPSDAMPIELPLVMANQGSVG